MGVVQFNSTDRAQAASLATALSNVPTSGYTVAFLVKRDATGTDFDAVGYLKTSSTTGTQVGLSFKNDDKFFQDAGITSGASVAALTSTTSTYIIVMSRPAGASQNVTYSWYLKSSNTWTHDTGVGSVSNGSACSHLELGAFEVTGDFLRAHLGLAAFWNVTLTQAQKQELSANWRTSDWYANTGGTPVCLIEGNTATPTDLIGNATSWSYTGLTLDGAETLDSWNFDGTGSAAPAAPVRRKNQIVPAFRAANF